MKEKLIALANKLGFAAKIKDSSMTSEDWQTFATEFKAEHGVDLLEAIKEAKKVPQLEKEQMEAFAALFNNEKEAVNDEPEKKAKTEPSGDDKTAKQTPADVNLAKEIANMKSALEEAQSKLKKLEQEPEDKGGKKVEIKKPEKVMIAGIGHSDKYLFGIPAPIFAMDKPWNKVAAKREGLKKRWEPDQVTAFKEEFNKYAASVANRIETLHERGLLGANMADRLAAIDYSDFEGTGWGEEYVVRRQDALISYIRSLPSVSSIFPVRYGVQNKMEMTNSFLTDFSQAYQSGHVFKGGYKLQPELAEVHDVMFKHQFENMKKLEKEYIGYLNREGSDPIKWSFIEWLMVETLKKLHNEQEARRVAGYRIEPSAGVPGHHMFGSTGIMHRLQKYVDDLKLNPFSDLALYTQSTVLDYVETFVEYVNNILPSLNGYMLYMNSKHIPWYLAAYREKYGTNLDFTGGQLEVKNYDLSGIKGVPNMGNSCLMLITLPGNIELYEDLPGEMEKVYFQRDLENLIAASWWKEGSGAYLIGKKYATKAEMEADKRKYQFIFLNDPVSSLAADATTADGSVNNRFKTIANSAATVLTDITNADEGVVYRITCGSLTNATTVAKSGKFANISAAWSPTAIGDFLEVYYDATADTFYEAARKVS